MNTQKKNLDQPKEKENQLEMIDTSTKISKSTSSKNEPVEEYKEEVTI